MFNTQHLIKDLSESEIREILANNNKYYVDSVNLSITYIETSKLTVINYNNHSGNRLVYILGYSDIELLVMRRRRKDIANILT